MGSSSVAMMFMVVVLPAPFGPTNPTTSPDENENDRSSTAFALPKTRVRWETEIFMVEGLKG